MLTVHRKTLALKNFTFQSRIEVIDCLVIQIVVGIAKEENVGRFSVEYIRAFVQIVDRGVGWVWFGRLHRGRLDLVLKRVHMRGLPIGQELKGQVVDGRVLVLVVRPSAEALAQRVGVGGEHASAAGVFVALVCQTAHGVLVV